MIAESGAETGLCFLSCEQVRPSGSDLDKAAGLSVIARVTQVNYHRCEIIARSGFQNNIIGGVANLPASAPLRLVERGGKHFLSSSFSCTFCLFCLFVWNFQRVEGN